MRWLIDYIRSCFCNHDWECLVDGVELYEHRHSIRPYGLMWMYRCTKCGYTKQISTHR